MSDHPEDEGDSPVGYRRPPKHTRFNKGTSGNPRGRPKKQADSPASAIQALLQAPCGTAVINGRRRTLTGQEALDRSMVKGAVAGLVADIADLFAELRARTKDCLKELPAIKVDPDKRRGGIMIVPAILPADEWEALAMPQQAKLIEDSRL